MGVTSQGAMTRKAPVRTEPHPTMRRGLPRCLPYDVTPYAIGRPIDEDFMGGHVVRRDDEKSPGSDGASPYHRRGLRVACL